MFCLSDSQGLARGLMGGDGIFLCGFIVAVLHLVLSLSEQLLGVVDYLWCVSVGAYTPCRFEVLTSVTHLLSWRCSGATRLQSK